MFSKLLSAVAIVGAAAPAIFALPTPLDPVRRQSASVASNVTSSSIPSNATSTSVASNVASPSIVPNVTAPSIVPNVTSPSIIPNVTSSIPSNATFSPIASNGSVSDAPLTEGPTSVSDSTPYSSDTSSYGSSTYGTSSGYGSSSYGSSSSGYDSSSYGSSSGYGSSSYGSSSGYGSSTYGSSSSSSYYSLDNYGGYSSMSSFDNFYGSSNYAGYHNYQYLYGSDSSSSTEVITETCSSIDITFVQQRLAILQEMAKRIITEQICEVEVQTIVLNQYFASWDSWYGYMVHDRSGYVGYDYNVAGRYSDLLGSDGSLTTGDLGFSGSSIGSALIVPSGGNWNSGSSPKSVDAAVQAAQRALDQSI